MNAPSKYVVAVVDDDSRVLESLESLLEAAGYEVRLFPSAEEFLAHTRGAQIDCLISDVGLSQVSGFELRELLRSERPGLPVILITGRSDPVTLQHAHRADGLLFFKPLRSNDLLAAVASLLARP